MLNLHKLVRMLRASGRAFLAGPALGLALWLGGMAVEGRAQIIFGTPNDNLTNAWQLVGNSGATNGDNYLATTEPLEPRHWFQENGMSVWFQWTPTNAGYYFFNTIGSTFDTLLAVYQGTNYGTINLVGLYPVGANDDYNPPGSLPTNFTSQVTFYAYPLTTYSIAVVGYGLFDYGLYDLNWGPALTSAGAVVQTNEVFFLQTNYTVAENTPGAATVTVIYQAVSNSPYPVGVTYATADGTALAGTDYLPVSGTLVFHAGETNKTFTIPIIDNAYANPNKTILLTLKAVSGGARLGSPTNAVVTIVDDETLPPPNVAGQFSFSSQWYRATQHEGEYYGYGYINQNNTLGYDDTRSVQGALITVTRSAPAVGRVMVDFATTNKMNLTNLYGGIYYPGIYTGIYGSAYYYSSLYFNLPYYFDYYWTSPVVLAEPLYDYAPTNGTLVFDDFEMSKTFVVPMPYNVGYYSSTFYTNMLRLVDLVLSNPRAASQEDTNLIYPTLGPTNEATLVIIDTDFNQNLLGTTNLVPGPSIVRSHYRLNEFGRREANNETNVNRVRIDIIYPLPHAQGDINVVVQRGNSQLSLFGELDAGSDFADQDTVTYPNTVFTDGSDPILNVQDFTAQDFNMTFDNRTFLRSFYITVTNDSMVEFNEDLFVRLYYAGGNNPEPGANVFANVTILYDDPPPGAVDREWNSPDVSYSTPPFNSAPGANNVVYAVAVQPDGRTVIGGDFTAYDATPRMRLARLLDNGFLDLSFVPGVGADNAVYAIAPYPAGGANAGRLLLGGSFTSYNGIQRNGVARLNANGSLDRTFNPGYGANGPVYAVTLQSDGRLLVGGDFTMFNGQNINRLVRLNDDGSVDLTFSNVVQGADAAIHALALRDVPANITFARSGFSNQVDDLNIIETGATAGTIVVNYNFPVANLLTLYHDNNTLFSQTLTGVGSVTNSYGTNYAGVSTQIRITMNEGLSGFVPQWRYTGAILPLFAGRTIYVGGSFTSFNGQYAGGVARLLDDGSVDPYFDSGSGANGTVWALAAQPDGKVLLGGAFTDVDFHTLNSIARLDTIGHVDESFLAGAGFDGPVYALALQSDMKPIVGGSFTSFNMTRRMGVARLFSSGSLDTGFMDTAFNEFAGLCRTFSTDPIGFVDAVALEPGGKVLIGGFFTNSLGGNSAYEFNNVYAPFPCWTRADKTQRFNVARLINSWGVLPTQFTTITSTNTNTVVVLNEHSPQGPGNLEFASTDYSIDEFGRTLAVTMRRVDGRLGTSESFLGSSNRTAVAGISYTAINTNVFWPEDWYTTNWYTRHVGMPTPRQVGYIGFNYLYVPIIDDTIIQGDHSFDLGSFNPQGTLYLGGETIPIGTALGASSARVTIIDNDFPKGTFMFAATGFTVNKSGVYANITVIRTNGANGNVAVQYYTDDNSSFTTATTNAARNYGVPDYRSTRGSLTFNSGQTSSSFQIPIQNNSHVDFDKTVLLVLTNATGGASLPLTNSITGATNSDSALLTIIDNNFAPGRVNFAATNFTIPEPARSMTGAVAVITVTRTGGSVGQLSVWAATADGTARSNINYLSVGTNLVWTNLDTSPKYLFVPLLNDQRVTGPLTVGLSLTDPRVANVSNPVALGNRSQSVLTIADSDSYGTFVFSSAQYAVDENGGAVTITVVRQGATVGRATVSYATLGADVVPSVAALPDLDYTNTFGTLVFDARSNDLSRTFQVPIIDNNYMDGNRDFLVSLTGVVMTTNSVSFPFLTGLGTPSQADVTIVDDESYHFPAGSLDTTFNENNAIGTDNPVYALAYQTNDDKIIMAGDFSRVNSIRRNSIARLNPDASLDGLFNAGSGPDGPIRALALQPDGRLLVGGMFTTINGTNRNHIARLQSDGSLDATFNPGAGADNSVFALALQPDGRAILGGSFTMFNGAPQFYIARLNASGFADGSFQAGAGPNAAVFALALQSDGKILLGGDFTQVNNNTNYVRLARLNPDGSLDLSFTPGLGADATVRAIVVQTDGRIVVGGSFMTFNGVPMQRLTRLNPDGTVDPTYHGAGANDSVYALALQTDGQLLVGGNFTLFNGVTRNRITRLTNAGDNDPSINFGEGANGFVAALAIQPDRNIILGGGFTEVQGRARLRVARLHGGSLTGSGNFEFSQAVYNVDAGQGYALVTVQRQGGTFNDAHVLADTQDGSALAPGDYTALATNLFFPQGEVIQSFIIPVLNSNFFGDAKSLLLSLTMTNAGPGTPINGDLGNQPSALMYLWSANAQVGFSDMAFSVAEGVQSGLAPITILRSGAFNDTVYVNFATAPGAVSPAVPGLDYLDVTNYNVIASSNLIITNFLIFHPGETSKVVLVPILGNKLMGGNRTVALTLSNVQPAGISILGLSSAVLTIVDDTARPGVVAFSPTIFSVMENGGTATIHVVRVNGSSGNASVRYTTRDGSARAGLDYLTSSGILNFADGEIEKLFYVTILDNHVPNPDKTVLLALSNPSPGVSLGGSSNATLLILDDEPQPTWLEFAQDVFTVSETNGPALVSVQRVGGRRGTVIAQLTTSDGSAVAGLHYRALTTNLIFLDAQTNVTVPITILDESWAEGPHDFNVSLSSIFPPTVGLGTNFGGTNVGMAKVKILDDDQTNYVFFAQSVYSVLETNPTMTVTVLRTNGVRGAIQLQVAAVDGTASAGLDYLPPTNLLVMADRQVSAALTVPILHNLRIGANPFSYFTLRLTTTNTGVVVVPALAATEVDILDYDQPGGLVDTNFVVGISNAAPGADGPVYCMALQANQHILLGGDFASVNGVTNLNRVARLNPDMSVDTNFLVWISGVPNLGADRPVFALATTRSGISHDGIDAAQSGGVAAGQSSDLRTTVNGPGQLSFWWKVSSETNGDYLQFLVDGVTNAAISGEVDWQLYATNLPAGTHVLQWSYVKNTDGITAGQDLGWLDQVNFDTPPNLVLPPQSLTVNVGETAVFSIAATGSEPLSYQWFHNGLAIAGANQTSLQVGGAAATDGGSYWVVVSNSLGVVVSSTALLAVNTAPVAPDLMWVRQVGDNMTDDGGSLLMEPNGSAYVLGTVGSPVLLGTTLINGGFLARYDAGGNVLWARSSAGISFNDWCVDPTGNGFYTIGGGVTLTHYTTNGLVDWTRTDPSGGQGYGIAATPNGDLFITGSFAGNHVLYGGVSDLRSTLNGPDILVARYVNVQAFGATGLNYQPVWAIRLAGADGTDYGYRIAVDAANNAYVLGYFEGLVGFGSDNLDAGAGRYGFFVTKLGGPSGTNLLWSVQEVNSSLNFPTVDPLGIALDAGTNVYVTWKTHTVNGIPTGYQLRKRDLNRNFLWGQGAAASYSDTARWVLDSAGNSYFAGTFSNQFNFSVNVGLADQGRFDGYLVKYDAGGQALWAIDVGGAFEDSVGGMGVDAFGGVELSGTFRRAVTFGNTNVAGASSNLASVVDSADMFLVKYGTRFPPVITEHPRPQIARMGATVTFSVQAAGRQPLTYQWQYRAQAGLAWQNVLGATNNPLILASVGAVSSGEYRAQVFNTDGSATSAPALLTVNPTLSLADVLDTSGLTWSNGPANLWVGRAERQVILGGAFTNVNGQPVSRLARLTEDGVVDTSFVTTNANNTVYALYQYQSGEVLVGGLFTSIGGSLRNFLVRLDADGLVETNFATGAGPNGAVRALDVQPWDGRIVIGGEFVRYSGTDRGGVARLNPDGSLDLTFTPPPGLNGIVYAVAAQADGKVLVGGSFTQVNGLPQNRLVRLNADGTLDSSFNLGTGPNNNVSAILVQLDGQILIGGSFTFFNGVVVNHIARLNSADGSMDTTINFGTGANDYVSALALQPDWKILLGGGFTQVNGVERDHIARLEAGLNPGAGYFQLSATNYQVWENATNVVITVLRSGGLAGPAQVGFRTDDGTAVAGTDYTDRTMVLNFVNGQAYTNVLVPILDNLTNDGDRTFQVKLSAMPPSGGVGPVSLASVLIRDNETTLGFSATDYAVNEDAGSIQIPVWRTGGTSDVVTVRYATQAGSATPGLDYTNTFGTLTFNAGETSKTFTVSIVNDLLNETNETVNLLLSSALPASSAFVGRSNALLTIIDNNNKPGTLAFGSANYAVRCDQPEAIINIRRTSGLAGVVNIRVTTVGQTALSGVDYTPVDLTLSFADGEVEKQVSVPILHHCRGLVTVGLVLSSPQGGAVLGSPVQATLTILDAQMFAGSVDPTFAGNYGANGPVYGVGFDEQQRLYVGGDFTFLSGLNENRLGRFNTNGTVDATFHVGAGFNQTVYALAYSATNELLVGGDFTTYDSQPIGRVALLQASGQPEPAFQFSPGANAAVHAVAWGGLSSQTITNAAAFSGSNGDTNTLLTGLPGGTLDVQFTFAAAPQISITNVSYSTNPPSGGTNAIITTNTSVVLTNGASLPNSIAILRAGAPITQQSVVVSGAPVVVPVHVSFPPATTGVGSNAAPVTTVTIVVNGGITNGTAWTYGGALTFGLPTDQQILIGGEFTTINGQPWNRVARLNHDGTLDATFAVGDGPDDVVYAVASQLTDGQVLIAGDFGSVNHIARWGIARLQTNGVVDPTFDPGYGADGPVFSIAPQPDGKIVIAGAFTSVGGSPSHGIARLNRDGTVDQSFASGTGAMAGTNAAVINAVRLQPDGKIVAAGAFTTLDGNFYNSVGRFNPDGTVDTSLAIGSGANAPAYSATVAPVSSVISFSAASSGLSTNEDRRVFDTGSGFGTLHLTWSAGSNSLPNSIRVYYQGRVIYDNGQTNLSGDVVVGYGPGASSLLSIVVNEDGTDPDMDWSYTGTVVTPGTDSLIAVGGDFTRFNGLPRGRVVVLKGTGWTYTPFDPAVVPDLAVFTLGLQTNATLPGVLGKVVAGGSFTSFLGVSDQNRVARVNLDGSLDTTFAIGAGADGAVEALVVQPNGQVVIGGQFTTFNHAARPYLARLNLDGSVDPAFNNGAGPNGSVYALAQQPDGRLLLGGEFTAVYGAPRLGLARLNTNGTLDVSFQPGQGAMGAVRALALQADGKVLVGGSFIAFNSQPVASLVRLNPNGTLDATFRGTNLFYGTVEALAVQADGKVVVGGSFAGRSGVGYTNLARLNTDGSLDPTFNIAGYGANDWVLSLLVQPQDQKILVGGLFTVLNGQTRNRLARLKTDGSLDPDINFGLGANNAVSATVLDPQGASLVVGGAFTEFDGQPRLALARLFAGANSGSGTFQFSQPAYQVNENGASMTLVVERVGGAEGSVAVTLATADGTATNRQHYIGVTNSLTFADAEVVRMVTISILDDTRTNIDRFFTAQLSVPSNPALVGVQSNTVVTIVDNDSVVSYSQPVYVARETDGSALITVVRQGGLTDAVTVQYGTTTNGSATPYLDFLPVGATLVFGPGVGVQSFRVPVLDDLVPELTETVDLMLSNVTGAASLGRAEATLNLLDGHPTPGQLTFERALYVVSESNATVILTVLRTNGYAGLAWASYATENGSAVAGANYGAQSGVITFADGVTRAYITNTILRDFVYTGDQTYLVRLYNLGGGVQAGSVPVATVKILDADPAPAFISFDSTDYTASEFATAAFLIVRRTNDLSVRSTVDYVIQNGTATNGVDYWATNGTLVFTNGETYKQIQILLTNNPAVQPDRTVLVSLRNPGTNVVLRFPTNATLTILDSSIQLRFTTNLFLANETDTNAVITVERIGQTNAQLTVQLFTGTNGLPVPAIPYLDFIPTNYLLIFTNGQLTATATIPVLETIYQQRDRTVPLFLTNVVGPATLGLSNANLVIRDTKQMAGEFTFDHSTYSVSEAAGTVTLTVLRTNGFFGSVQVQYRTLPGTALPGSNYVQQSGVLIFGQNVASQTISIPILNDNLSHGNATFDVVLENPSPAGAIVTGALTEVTIQEVNFGPGALDTSFDPGTGANATVNAVAVQQDGRVVAAGAFTNFNGVLHNHLVRLQPNGVLDPNFLAPLVLTNPVPQIVTVSNALTGSNVIVTNLVMGTNILGAGPNGSVSTLGVQPNGSVMFAGVFTNYAVVSGTNLVTNVCNRVGRVLGASPDGSLDVSLSRTNDLNAEVRSVALLPSVKLYLAGGFSKPKMGLTRFLGNGATDAFFDTGTGLNGFGHAVAAYTNRNMTDLYDEVVVGGDFTTANGLSRSRVARFFTYGSVDEAFVPPLVSTGAVFAVAVVQDLGPQRGKVLIAGDFTTVGGVTNGHIARLLADSGNLDSSFNPGQIGADGVIYAMALLANGQILIGGDFTNYNGFRTPRLARLNADGSLDRTFTVGFGADATVYSIALEPDGNIVIGGRFTHVFGFPRNGVARLLGDFGAARVVGAFPLRAVRPAPFTLDFESPGVCQYIIQTSSDLRTWKDYYTNVTVAGPNVYRDLALPGTNVLFYRVRLTP